VLRPGGRRKPARGDAVEVAFSRRCCIGGGEERHGLGAQGHADDEQAQKAPCRLRTALGVGEGPVDPFRACSAEDARYERRRRVRERLLGVLVEVEDVGRPQALGGVGDQGTCDDDRPLGEVRGDDLEALRLGVESDGPSSAEGSISVSSRLWS